MAFAVTKKEKPVGYISDKRLYVTADRSEIVEEDDPRAAFLLVSEGGELSNDDAEKYGLKAATKAEDKEAAPAEDKATDAEEAADDLSCPDCDFVAKSAGGLTRHVNSQHEGE